MEIKLIKAEPMEEKDSKYQEHELECAVDTLMRAQEIKEDKDMMAALKPLLDKKAEALKNLAGEKIDTLDKLKAKKKEMIEKKGE